LSQGELKHNQGVTIGASSKSIIPFTSDKVIQLYHDAADGSKENVLLLDITNTRVNAPGNIYIKAKLTQEYLKRERDADVAVVCIDGRGMKYRLPGQGWVECDKGTTVCETLGTIEGSALSQDAADENATDTMSVEGLVESVSDNAEDTKADKAPAESVSDNADDTVPDMVESVGDNADDTETDKAAGEIFKWPIFVFGFAKMRRGISYRSSRLVPTHLVLHMGSGHHIENVVQTTGRGTFNGKTLLRDNGHSHVTVLMTNGDWDMVQAHQKYIAEVHKRVKLGTPVLEAMAGAEEALPDYANYLQHTPRRTGLRPKHKPSSFDSMHDPAFKATNKLTEGLNERAKVYAAEENVECFRVLKICHELWHKKKDEFMAEDIVEAFNDDYRDRHDVKPLTKTRCLKQLRDFITKDKLVSEKPSEKKGSKRFSLDKGINERTCTFIKRVRELRSTEGKRKTNSAATEPSTKRHKGTSVERVNDDGRGSETPAKDAKNEKREGVVTKVKIEE